MIPSLLQLIEDWLAVEHGWTRSRKPKFGEWKIIPVDAVCHALHICGSGAWVVEIECDHIIIDYKVRTRIDAADPLFFKKLATSMTYSKRRFKEKLSLK